MSLISSVCLCVRVFAPLVSLEFVAHSGSFKEVSRVFEGSFMDVSRKFE